MSKLIQTIKQLHELRRTQGDLHTSELDRLVAFAATQDADHVLDRFGTTPEGLDPDLAGDLAQIERDHIAEDGTGAQGARRFVRAVANPFNFILIALAVISFYTNVTLAAPEEQDPSTAIIIGVMVVISVALRFTQETKGADAAQALKSLVTTTCTVVRGGDECEIALDEVVPGDIVRLSAGDLVPADVRILRAKDLFVMQSALTGESEPVEKTAQTVDIPYRGRGTGISLEDCANIAFSGTTIQSGSATAVAVRTGSDTYLGRMARVLQQAPTKTSFDRGLESVSRVLVAFMLVMCPIVFLINGATKGDWLSALLFSISVAVGITPQMLPVIVTTCLARGAATMSKHDVVVKDINAIQNLGAMDVLCTDKTGTLTQDKVILERHMDVMGNDDERVLRHAYLNSHFQTGLKNLIDIAVIERARELEDQNPDLRDIDARYTKVDEIPFDFERRRMSVVVEDRDGKTQLITKGAVEEILGVCSDVEYEGVVRPLTDELRERVAERVEQLNAEGMRVIAVAQKSNPRAAGAFCSEDERDMVLMGYLALLDPPKESAARAVELLEGYGVTVKVLTGDNEGVAAAVCRKVGIDPGEMLLGSQIDELDDAELAERVERAGLLAKLSPLQKQRVVSVLREQGGHTVGFMGDGINDAAAMRASDCGISVDTAVDIAKESADIILLKKDLMVLGHGILEGRRTYGNTIKYIKATASSNFGNVLSVLVASAFLPFLPMTALQLLLLGAAYTVSCTAIPWDRVDDEFLREPKTWDANSIVSFMLWLGPVSSIFDVATFAAMFFVICPMVLGAGWSALAGDAAAMALFAVVFQTGWFVESMWTQTFVLHMLRTEHIPFVGSKPAAALSFLTIAGVAIVTVLPYVPVVGPALGLSPLPLVFFGFLAVCMVSYLLLCSIVKALYVRAHGALL
ncbi:MAG: magnesium-translocating P-type ATPase [Collinsella sp.]|nr:magnesium-translocating P-type ATPase [Collinsella sp.]